ncbi:toxin-antitoxin system HicB family antitoxin [Gardnerella vaginalis]|nr:toxin-antitoxin system HicB family antitoxin [Gardnerella vaginalis]
MEDLLLPITWQQKEPSYHELNDYSGQFKLRLPKELHRQLSEQSQAEGISMNQYCVYLLSQNNAIERVLERA